MQTAMQQGLGWIIRLTHGLATNQSGTKPRNHGSTLHTTNDDALNVVLLGNEEERAVGSAVPNSDTAISKAHSTRNWPWKKRSPSASVYLSLSERKSAVPGSRSS